MSQGVVDKIIGSVGDSSSFFEIGPGPAVLTEPLSQLGSTWAIEADPGMARLVSVELPGVQVIHADALQVDWADILSRMAEPRAIVSNMPYNITGPLLDRVCRVRGSIQVAVLMMQREVGERILAPAGHSDRGALSVVVQALFGVSRVCLVPPGAFAPPPKVDSVVLRFVPKLDPVSDEFLDFVRRGFGQPRKTLSNNLRLPAEMFALADLDPRMRGHQLSQEQWMRLFDVAVRRSES